MCLNMFSVLEICSPMGVKYLLNQITTVFCKAVFLSIPFASFYSQSMYIVAISEYILRACENQLRFSVYKNFSPKEWKALTAVKEIELITAGDSPNQI